MKYFIFLVAVISALCIVSVASADKRTILYSPNPAHVGDSLVLSGCGYTPGEYLQVQAVHNSKTATTILQIGETIDSAGCFSTDNAPYTLVSNEVGKWVANVFDYNTGLKESTLNFYVVN